MGRPIKHKLLIAALCLAFLALLILGCVHFIDRYAETQIQKLDIVMTGVEAEFSITSGAVLKVTAELRNTNTAWVDLIKTDYCLTVNGVKVHCGRHPKKGAKVRIVAENTTEVAVTIKPGTGNSLKLLEAVASRVGLPKARLEGTAWIESPVGNLEFPFKTKEITFELKKIGLKIDLSGGKKKESKREMRDRRKVGIPQTLPARLPPSTGVVLD